MFIESVVKDAKGRGIADKYPTWGIVVFGYTIIIGKGLHSSTSQLNLRRFCRCDLYTWPTKSAHVEPKSGRL
jgi:hypothetical protein